MLRSIGFSGAALAALAMMGILAEDLVSAQVAKGKSRPAATRFLMRGITQPHCKGIGELLKDSGPTDDKGWETVACHASCLNELSFSLMQDGRCPDATWAGAAKSLGEATAAVLASSEKKDLEATRAAFKTVTDACKTCHDAHRKVK